MPRPLPAVLATCVALLAPPAAAQSARDYRLEADAHGDYVATASYVNLNRDPLTLVIRIARDWVRQSMDEFGYALDDPQRLARECSGCTQEDYEQRLDELYRSRALAWSRQDGERRLYVDIPAVVQRNRERLKPLAGAFDRLAKEKGYGPDETLGAMLAFVQSALLYKGPPDEEGGRDILGFYPPPRALEAGYGDCDTKSALLAAVMANFPGIRLIGIHVPRHYLLGIARVPRDGDAFIEYQGEPFVLVEPAGPARLPPGMIGPLTQAALATMAEIRIDPLF